MLHKRLDYMRHVWWILLLVMAIPLVLLALSLSSSKLSHKCSFKSALTDYNFASSYDSSTEKMPLHISKDLYQDTKAPYGIYGDWEDVFKMQGATTNT